MTTAPALDALRQPIKPGDQVVFLDGRVATVLTARDGEITYDGGNVYGWCYSFLAVLCEPPASVEAEAVVAQATDMQGASLSSMEALAYLFDHAKSQGASRG